MASESGPASAPLSVPADAALTPAPSPIIDETVGVSAITVIDVLAEEKEEGKGSRPSRASTVSTESETGPITGRPSKRWQITLESFEEKKIPHDSVHPKVRHFYKRQNDIIDNLIAWHDNLGKDVDEAVEGTLPRFYIFHPPNVVGLR